MTDKDPPAFVPRRGRDELRFEMDGDGSYTFNSFELADGQAVDLERVPPPPRVLVDDAADVLGLCPGLRVERCRDVFRCHACGKLQPSGYWLVWVPDSVRRGDSVESVMEAARLGAYNGHDSGWCLACAPTKKRGLWQRMFGGLRRIRE